MRLVTRWFGAQAGKSIADVTGRKGRTLLISLAIFISVAGLTSINMTEATLYSALTFTTGINATQPDIDVAVNRLDASLAATLASLPNVRAVEYQTQLITFWEQSPSVKSPLRIVSYPDLARVAITPFQLASGRYPGVGEAVMEYGDQDLHPFTIGGFVTVQTHQGTARLRVVGVARTPGQNPAASGNALAYMSDTALAALAAGVGLGGVPGKAPPFLDHQILIKVHNRNLDQATAAAVQRVLLSDQITVFQMDIPAVNANAATLAAVESIFSLVRLLCIVAIVLAAILILNIVTAVVTEQMGVIGSMKAIGGTRGTIMRGYLASVVLYSALGTIPGLAAGVYGGYRLASALAIQAQLDAGTIAVPPWIVAVGLAAGFGVPPLAALFPIWLGTRTTVREAISDYGIHATGTGQERRHTPRLSGQLGGLSQVTRTGLIGLFRRRGRLAMTVITLAVAGTSFLVVQTAATSVSATVGAVNANSSADLDVYFNDASLYAQISGRLYALPNVERIERYCGYHAATQWGTLAVFGYEPDTRIYHYQLTSGRWLRPGDTNVVLLSDGAAARTGLHIGDDLIVNGGMSLAVIGTVKQSINVLGWIGAVVMPVNTAYELRGIPPAVAANSGPEVIVAAHDHSNNAVYQLGEHVNAIVNPTDGYADGTGYFSGGRGSVDTTYEYTTRRQQTWYVLYYVLYAVALLVAVTGGLGLVNALLASALERRREIGMLRAMGASSRQVAKILWVEGLAQGGFAWVIGALIGVPLAYAFVAVLSASVMPLDFSVDATAFLVMLVAVTAIAALASLVPAWGASRQRLAVLLRYE
jgi:putative ABC transport system permease protein